MKKKFAISLLTGAILLGGAGTFAYAQTGGFEEMKPHMEKAHPELSTQELQKMYNDCHGDGGMMDKYEKSVDN
ncbi:hypothetical protein [Pallidibacillus thermolactis]|jgi:hypothetical protein|uniref:hypothetical protein n=1 Tax=Pallidibacillus thermolactis TaxID=251051 RepID=UPI0021DAB0D4|nr:hypothetical protein [Pallidibacillus thermolactis]MCU9599881.1 hypothetical protein [Pallidibacillus thermolactis subsp. kokeshiiformis]